MQFDEVLFGRRSVREYRPDPVSREDVDYMLKDGEVVFVPAEAPGVLVAANLGIVIGRTACRVAEAEAMMRRSGIRWLSTTTKSIEEIATTILTALNIAGRTGEATALIKLCPFFDQIGLL